MEIILMSILHLQNVCKSFDRFEALKDITFQVEKGETIVIIGPSGCGKSTLLRCIALFEEIDKGAIYMNEQAVINAINSKKPQVNVNLNQYRTRVGIVFQHLHVWPHLTVLDNLILAIKVVYKVSKKEATEKAQVLLEKMGIGDKINKYPHSLSGGELQRVAIARALMVNPEILLLDEITSALDPELVGEVLDIIAELAKSGMTLLIVTHEMLFASEVADRVLFIDEGKLIEEGEPLKIFRQPKTLRLKTFLRRVSLHRFGGVMV
jgi:ABC-type polar amino acid transport system ATPase subunit